MSDPCDCDFDYPEPDGGESWHFTRTCPSCGDEWGVLDCPHDDPGWICMGCRPLASYAV